MFYIRRRSREGDEEDPRPVGALIGMIRSGGSKSIEMSGRIARDVATNKPCSLVEVLNFGRASTVDSRQRCLGWMQDTYAGYTHHN